MAVSRVLLDTSAYSAGERGHKEVGAALTEADQIVFSPVVLGELRAGFLGGSRPGINEQALQKFLNGPRVTVIPMGEETAHCYAVIAHGLKKSGAPIPTNDIWIAASAMEHGLPVLTVDGDFQRVAQIRTLYFPA
jgi:predicted nucleic acid-binding protein